MVARMLQHTNPDTPFHDFGRYLAELRVRMGLTQEVVAKHLDIGRATLIRYETGVSLPPVITLFDMAVLYDRPIVNVIMKLTFEIYRPGGIRYKHPLNFG